MNRSLPQPRSIRAATWVGILIALFAMLVVRQAVIIVWPSVTTSTTVVREGLYWLCAIALLIIVRCGENRPVTSIGIGTRPLIRSFAWAIPLAFLCLLVGGGIALLTHFNGGRSGESLEKLPLWLLILVVIRAGVVEELFYRGYAIERLRAIGLNRQWALAIPLLIFSFAHWKGGWANILIAFALGVVFSLFYLWRRDLVANMIGHFAVDFVSIILPKLLHH
jgi:membrane protease YdiL (CAAX protease family)